MDFYETTDGETIFTMKKESPTMLTASTSDGIRVMDPVLSRVRAGEMLIYVEEIPEFQRAQLGETFSPRRN